MRKITRPIPRMPDLTNVNANIGKPAWDGGEYDGLFLPPVSCDPVAMARIAVWAERLHLTADARTQAWAYTSVAQCQKHMDYLAHDYPGIDGIPGDAPDLFDCRSMYIALKARRDQLAGES